MSGNFAIVALPRSRTKWLSELLTDGHFRCVHDASKFCGSIPELLTILNYSRVGICDTALALVLPEVLRQKPELKLVVVRRPIGEVVASLCGYGLRTTPEGMAHLAAALDWAAEQPGALIVEYKDLADYEVCNTIYQFCRGGVLPRERWMEFHSRKIEVPLAEFLAEMERLGPNAKALYGEKK